jgi:hypothetical protein
VGGKPARKLTDQDLPKPSDIRFDKVGTPDFPLPDPAHGVAQMLPEAILKEDPYPIKALFAYRFDPLMSIADTALTRKALDKLDLIVAIDINYSDIAWYSDVILPESTYLERLDSPQQANGLKPQIFLRQQAVGPRYDTRPGPELIRMLAERMGVSQYFPYDTVEELVRWQLEPTGFTLADFAKKGFVSYGDKPVWWDRESGIKFKTPSGKIEFVSSLLENAGYPSFPAYKSPDAPKKPDTLTAADTVLTSRDLAPFVSPSAPGNTQPESVPGAIGRASLDLTHWLTWGYGRDELAVPIPGGFLRPTQTGVNVAVFEGADAILAGFTWPGNTEKFLPGSVWATVDRAGRGNVVAFAESPLFRSFWRGPAMMFANAVMYGAGR